MSEASEARLLRVSRRERDWHARKAWALRDEARCRREILDRDMADVLDREAEQHEALVAAWDAGGVVDPRFAEVARDLAEALRLTQEYVGDELLPNKPGWSHFDARKRYEEIARAAAGGEAAPAGGVAVLR